MAKKFVTLDRLATFLDQIKSLIPTVNNSTITIKQAGTQKGTFTLNQSGNTTIELTDANTTYSAATTSANGLMSSSDKSKLDGITAGATKVTVDTALSSSSTNPVQNKVINTALAGKAASSHTHTKSDVGLGNVDNTADSTKSVASATKATQDSAGQQINTTYIKGLSVSGQKITYTKGDGTTGTITTQDTNTTYSAATTSANGLMSSTDKTKLNNTNVAFGTCDTEAATAAKVITISGNTNWTLTTGAIIGVKSTYSNSASSVTLNVNGTGAKQIWYSGAVYTSTASSVCGYAGRYIWYMYDGTYWVWMGHSYDANTNTTYSAATTSANGLMSSTDKSKLDGIATGANNYTHPTTSGNKHIPSGGSSGQILRWSADGTAVWGADNNTTYSAATTSAAGLMSAADKSKLDGVATGANAYTLPTATSSTLGGVKTGSNITNSSGTISVTKANVVSALAYTPDPEGFLSLASYNGSNGNWYETFGNGTKVFFYGGADTTTYQLPARNCSVLVTRYDTYYATALCILRSSSGHDTQVWVNKSTGEQDPTEAESWEGWTELASVNDVNSAIAGIQSQLDGVEDLLAAI